MKSLAVLERLAKQSVDHERQALQAIGAAIADVEGQIEAVIEAIEREASASPDFMTGGATLTTFIKASNERVRKFRDRLGALQEAYVAQIERVRLERVEQKRYELLAERRARQAAENAAMREQKTIDELVTIKAGRRRPARG